jgi:3-keto-L-gulonate-6-phosphate decarboxylase
VFIHFSHFDNSDDCVCHFLTMRKLQAEGREYEEWQKQLDLIYQKDVEKRNRQKKADEDTAEALRQQMADNRRMKDEYFDRMQQEAEEEIADVSSIALSDYCYLLYTDFCIVHLNCDTHQEN